MITRFKSGLNQIKAEDDLFNKTEIYLRNTLTKNQEHKVIKLSQGRFFYLKKIAMVACFAILIIATSGGAYTYYMTPVSYLCLDINPSIELGVNAFGKVVKAEGCNFDGDMILNEINVKENNVTKAIKILMFSVIDNGFIAEDGSTVISIISETDNPNTANKLETDAEAGAQEALKENGKTAVIYKDNVSLSLREEAKLLGITAGKLNLINKLQLIDPTVTVEQYKYKSVKDIMKSIQNNNNNTDKSNIDNKEEGNINNKAKSDLDQKYESYKNVKDEIGENNKYKNDNNIKNDSEVNNEDESGENIKDDSEVNNEDEIDENIEDEIDENIEDEIDENIVDESDENIEDESDENIEEESDESIEDENIEKSSNQTIDNDVMDIDTESDKADNLDKIRNPDFDDND